MFIDSKNHLCFFCSYNRSAFFYLRKNVTKKSRHSTAGLASKNKLSGEIFKESFTDIFQTNLEQVAFVLQTEKESFQEPYKVSLWKGLRSILNRRLPYLTTVKTALPPEMFPSTFGVQPPFFLSFLACKKSKQRWSNYTEKSPFYNSFYVQNPAYKALLCTFPKLCTCTSLGRLRALQARQENNVERSQKGSISLEIRVGDYLSSGDKIGKKKVGEKVLSQKTAVRNKLLQNKVLDRLLSSSWGARASDPSTKSREELSRSRKQSSPLQLNLEKKKLKNKIRFEVYCFGAWSGQKERYKTGFCIVTSTKLLSYLRSKYPYGAYRYNALWASKKKICQKVIIQSRALSVRRFFNLSGHLNSLELLAFKPLFYFAQSAAFSQPTVTKILPLAPYKPFICACKQSQTSTNKRFVSSESSTEDKTRTTKREATQEKLCKQGHTSTKLLFVKRGIFDATKPETEAPKKDFRAFRGLTKPIVLGSSGRVVTITKTQLVLQKTQPVLFYSSAHLHVKRGEWVEEGSPILTLTHQTLITGDIVQGIPRIEQLFEAFTSPPPAFKDRRSPTRFRDVHDTLHSQVRDIFRKHWLKSVLPIAVRKSLEEIQYILVEMIQKVYLSQGVLIADKHIEIVVRQIASKGQILDSGTTGLFLEEVLPVRQIENANLTTPGKKCLYMPAVMGLTAASLNSDSFVSAASFQETTRVLSRDAVVGKSDFLRGLKEKVVIGDLISAGTGLEIYFVYTTMLLC